MEKEAREPQSGMIKKVVFSLAIFLSIFHLYTGGFGLLTPMLQRSVHLYVVIILVFLMY